MVVAMVAAALVVVVVVMTIGPFVECLPIHSSIAQ
jgi:hypothetical protein